MKYKKLTKIKTEQVNGSEKYFCLVRKSFIPATPEEKVRQNFLDFLINQKQFPISKIRVEESLAHYGKGNRRVDILVLDENEIPFIIYECKKEFEPMTDEVRNQALDYYEKLDTVEFLGFVIGDDLELLGGQENSDKAIYYAEHPDYYTLINGGEVQLIKPEEFIYKRNNWKKPIKKEIIKELIDFGIIGEGTDEKYHSFLTNLDGWLLDQKDKLNFNKNIEDIGVKLTKFGSAGGGFFAKEFRSFLVKNRKDKPIVCIALTSMAGGENSPVGTVIMVGVETAKNKNASLELRIGKSLNKIEGRIKIEHNGTITVGRLGASKRQDLLDFVEEKKPNLIKNGNVFLGEFDENQEINAQNIQIFIRNIIDYALLRNEFRELKKNNAIQNSIGQNE